MTKPMVLIQLDSDTHASAFDAIVALDSGVERLLQYGAVAPSDVRSLVHGAMFTRGSHELSNTAIFVGGSDVAVGETLLKAVTDCFFGRLRVSVLLDASGANTTAAAAVLAAARHVDLNHAEALVLAATGPVGQRVVRLLAHEGAKVRVGSRREDRAVRVCDAIRDKVPGALLTPYAAASQEQTAAALAGANIVISAGAAGIQLLPASLRTARQELRVAIDLNAVPPVGIEGVEVTDKGADRDGVLGYGAIGVGGTKMRIHKAAIKKLFERNDQILDAEEIFAIGRELDSGAGPA